MTSHFAWFNTFSPCTYLRVDVEGGAIHSLCLNYCQAVTPRKSRHGKVTWQLFRLPKSVPPFLVWRPIPGLRLGRKKGEPGDCVLRTLSGWTRWLLVGTRTPGGAAGLSVQESWLATDPNLACDWEETDCALNSLFLSPLLCQPFSSGLLSSMQRETDMHPTQ